MSACPKPGVWFPAVRASSGTDVFTERLADGLRRHGLRSEITWLPLRAEYAPWSVQIPRPPAWANIVHVNTWLHPRFLPKHLPVIATLHHSAHHFGLQPYKGPLRAAYHAYWIKPYELRTLRRADRVVAVSRFAADTARATLLDRPMPVVFNGVDTRWFRPPDRRGPHQPFRLLYVGKWAAMKGVGLLAPIMRELGDGFELRFTGGGFGNNGPDMPPNMHDLGRLKGPDAVISAMQDADALLFPSRSEGFPMVVVEALSCGLPVVASDIPSLAEAIQDDVTGYLVRVDDVMAFAAACRALSRDRGRYERLASEARGRAEGMFSIDAMVREYLDIYEDVLIQQAAPG